MKVVYLASHSVGFFMNKTRSATVASFRYTPDYPRCLERRPPPRLSPQLFSPYDCPFTLPVHTNGKAHTHTHIHTSRKNTVSRQKRKCLRPQCVVCTARARTQSTRYPPACESLILIFIYLHFVYAISKQVPAGPILLDNGRGPSDYYLLPLPSPSRNP